MQLTKKTSLLCFEVFLFISLSLTLCSESSLFSLTTQGSGRVKENIIDIWDITTTGFSISILLSEDLPTIVTSGQTFFLVILYGNGTTWDAAVVFSYDQGTNVTIHYMFDDPLQGPYFWIVGSEDMVDIIGQLIEITFLEYSTYNSGNVEMAVLALTSLSVVQDFLQSFSQTMIDYSDAFSTPIALPTISVIILPPQTSSETKSTFSPQTSTSVASSSPVPPDYIELTDSSETKETSKTEESSESGLISPGFEPLLLLISISLLFLTRKYLRAEKREKKKLE